MQGRRRKLLAPQLRIPGHVSSLTWELGSRRGTTDGGHTRQAGKNAKEVALMGYHRSGWAGLVVIAFSAVHAGCSSSESYPGDRAPAGGGIGGTMATGGTSGMGGTGETAGSTGSAGGTTTTTGTPLLMCDPSVDSVVDEGCGVFVSSSKGDDMAGDGTKANPFATIAKAVSAVGDMGRLYLCAEDFVEAVSVSNGVVIHGGLDCSDMKWPWVGNMTKTKIAPNQGEIPLTVDSQVALTVEDVAFEATARTCRAAARRLRSSRVRQPPSR